MTTTKKSSQPALIIIDIQNHYLRAISERDKEIGLYFINLLIDLFRKNNLPIIRVYHHDSTNGANPGTDQFEYPQSVKIKPDDHQIIKSYGDSFNKTSLAELLNKERINTVFLCGLSAVGCVISTFIGARNHDINVFLAKDAIMSHNTEYTKNIEMMFDAVSYDVIKVIVEK